MSAKALCNIVARNGQPSSSYMKPVGVLRSFAFAVPPRFGLTRDPLVMLLHVAVGCLPVRLFTREVVACPPGVEILDLMWATSRKNQGCVSDFDKPKLQSQYVAAK